MPWSDEADVPGAVAIVNGRVETRDPRRPRADAILLHDGAVQLVGRSAEVLKLADADTVIHDARGAAVTSVEHAVLRRGAQVTVTVHTTADPASPVAWRVEPPASGST
jgi:hypothetical protein